MKKRVRKGDQKKRDKTVGTFPLSKILNGKMTKILGKRICLSKKSLFVSPKFFGLYVGLKMSL